MAPMSTAAAVAVAPAVTSRQGCCCSPGAMECFGGPAATTAALQAGGWRAAWQRWVAQLPAVAREQYAATRASYTKTAEEGVAVRAAAQQEEAEYPHTAVWRWLRREAYREPKVDFCPIDKAPYTWTWMVMPLALCSSFKTDVALGAIPIATLPRWGQGRSSRRELRDGRWHEVLHESELSRRFRYWADADLQTRQQRLRQLFDDMTAECVHRFDTEVTKLLRPLLFECDTRLSFAQFCDKVDELELPESRLVGRRACSEPTEPRRRRRRRRWRQRQRRLW